MKTFVTTVLKPDEETVRFAKERAIVLGFPYVPRRGLLEDEAKTAGADGFLIYGRQLPVYWTPKGMYRFHLGTAVLRIHEMEKGNHDRLCSLLPENCSSVLDCTFGQGGDATVLSWFLGEKGNVTSLEKSTELFEIGKTGLAAFTSKRKDIDAALRRISILRFDFKEYLQTVPEKSFDVVYFDTMFRAPVKREENHAEGFRAAACYDLLDDDVLRLAMRAAKRKVIVKERPFSIVFKSPLFTEIHARKGQTTAYGEIRL